MKNSLCPPQLVKGAKNQQKLRL